jgi:hypothetical protein
VCVGSTGQAIFSIYLYANIIIGNWVLLNHTLQNPWVLFLDADEFVDDAFCDEAAEAVQSTTFSGYWLNYRNHFLGRRLRFGVPQRKLALFKAGTGLYERIDEDHWSALDMEVHEHPVVAGPVGVIRAPIDHRDDRGILRFVDRHRDYARWEASRAIALKSTAQQANAPHLTARQRLKYSRISEWWFPYLYFCAQFFLRLGILDGHAGLQYAFYKFWYFSTVRLLILEETSQASRATAPSTPVSGNDSSHSEAERVRPAKA